MAELGIIGGTGLTSLKGLEITRKEVVHTPYGEPSAPIIHGVLSGKEVLFLARHGAGHTIPPHAINYRANMWALEQCGVKQVIAVAAVGGIHKDAQPGCIVIPDQIIDYSWGRISTYFEGELSNVTHVDFSYPYSDSLRKLLIKSCKKQGILACETGVYAATQGPRLETAAEVSRLENDGCTIVGMTGMPEATLARELKLEYVTCAVVANWAAGKGDGSIITMAGIEQNLVAGMDQIRKLLEHTVPQCVSK